MRPGRGAWLLRAAPAVLLLNALLTLENLFPTLWPRPAMRLSFELGMAVAVLAAWIAWRGVAGKRVLRAFALVTVFWTVARYLDVTVSAVFGRQVNLYWDSRHLMEVVRMTEAARWQIVSAAVVAAAVPVLLYHLALRCWHALALALARPRPQITTGATALVLLATFAAHGINGRNTRWFFSMPVAPIVAGQAALLAGQLLPGGAAAQLSPSPDFADHNLLSLGGADVLLIFAESYGVSTLDDPQQAAGLAPHRERLQQALRAGGRQVVSARVRSPTFGGASWLAHAALLSGVDTQDPGAYELLLTTGRPSLVSHFKAHGWRTVNWMPGLQRPWPEGSFYGFDRYADAARIGYLGPQFGHWRIPDQASMALLHAQELAQPNALRKPAFIVFPTLASHAPFGPIAPYVDDWERLLRADAYLPPESGAAEPAAASWLRPVPAYLDSLAYTFRWLGDYLSSRAPRTLVTIVIGDHQPLASVSGSGASWDVPVHVISGDRALLARFEARGFMPGLLPVAPSLASMQGLTPLLLGALDGMPPGHAGAAE